MTSPDRSQPTTGTTPRPVVIDASVLAKLLLPEELSDRAHALVRRATLAGAPIHCPATAIADVADTLYSHSQKDRLTTTEATTALSILGDLPLDTSAPDDFWPSVLAFARDNELRHLDVAQAVVLAEMLGGELWTGHRDTWAALHHAVPWMRWVGDAPELPPANGTSADQAK